MTSKRVKLEHEIEKNRNLANWEAIKDDVALLAEKVGKKDATIVLVQAELDFELELIKAIKGGLSREIRLFLIRTYIHYL